MPRKVFVAGEILTASDVNVNLMDQTVMTFAGTAARGSAIPSPVEGMAVYLEDSDILALYDGSAWKNSLGVTGGILQVVSAFTSTTTTTTGSSFIDTSLTASITPSSTSSRIIILVSVAQMTTNNNAGSSAALLVRGNASLRLADIAQSALFTSPTQDLRVPFTVSAIDSPNSTSTVQYSLLLASPESASNTASIVGAQRMVLMEVAG
jgi:hypothetical protein